MSTDEKNLVVRQSNELIEASYKIASVGEGRLMRMLIAQISPSDEDFRTYRISVADFASFFNITHNSVHEQIEMAARSLREREVLIRKGKSWFSTGWLSSAEYIEGTGYVEVSIHARLKPYLIGLKSYFTQYELENIVNFKSGYAMRLFELLKKEQFKAGGGGHFQRSFEYDELRDLLGIEKKEYAFFKDFRVKCIDVAVREINANPDIFILSVEFKKTGRKYSRIIFHCEKNRQRQLPIKEPVPKFEEAPSKQTDQPEEVRQMVLMGIDEATAYKWRKKYGVKRLARNIAYTQAMKTAGKIRDSETGFLARAIADNLGGAWEEEAKQTRKVRDERAAKDQLKQDAEDAQKNAEMAERATIMQAFQSLTSDEQQAHRKAYADQATGLYLKMWQSANEASPDAPETDKRVLVLFLKFFKDQTRHDE